MSEQQAIQEVDPKMTKNANPDDKVRKDNGLTAIGGPEHNGLFKVGPCVQVGPHLAVCEIDPVGKEGQLHKGMPNKLANPKHTAPEIK